MNGEEEQISGALVMSTMGNRTCVLDPGATS